MLPGHLGGYEVQKADVYLVKSQAVEGACPVRCTESDQVVAYQTGRRLQIDRERESRVSGYPREERRERERREHESG